MTDEPKRYNYPVGMIALGFFLWWWSPEVTISAWKAFLIYGVFACAVTLIQQLWESRP
jgi:hypothetical protein